LTRISKRNATTCGFTSAKSSEVLTGLGNNVWSKLRRKKKKKNHVNNTQKAKVLLTSMTILPAGFSPIEISK
jgi:hypothetical protein